MWFAKSGWYHNMIPTKNRGRRTRQCLKSDSSPPLQSRTHRRPGSLHTAECLPIPRTNSTPTPPRSEPTRKVVGAREDWELVDIFADEGLTGMKSDTRDEFQRMIRMCELKQIDLIVTKSISRFARNTKDALAYVRKLRAPWGGGPVRKRRYLDALHGR